MEEDQLCNILADNQSVDPRISAWFMLVAERNKGTSYCREFRKESRKNMLLVKQEIHSLLKWQCHEFFRKFFFMKLTHLASDK